MEDEFHEPMEQELEEEKPGLVEEKKPKNGKGKAPAKAKVTKKKGGKAKANNKNKTRWEASDGEDEKEVDHDPLTEPVTIDHQSLLTNPSYENEGAVREWDAEKFTLEEISKEGLGYPILFKDQKDVLDIHIPDVDYTDILELIPPGQKIDMFDHKTEKTKNAPVSTIIAEIQKPESERVGPLNMLSLECSYFELGKLVKPPKLIRELDWGNNVFPHKKFKDRKYPRVEKYAIVTMAGAYTEFHIDFAGTSVWYHIKKGRKAFFLIEPTAANLHMYEEYINAYRSGASVGFFGDVVNAKCTRVIMEPGNTLILPAGWIHAVYTTDDSLVFGGNFLHSFSIPLQITVRDQETRGQTKKKFTYYCYEQTLWYYMAYVVEQALGKKYVRLISSNEYRDLVAKARSKPEDFTNCCYDIELGRNEFYDDYHPGEPLQTSFDAADEKINPPPVKFNDEYLHNMTPFEKSGLYKVKSILNDSLTPGKNKRLSRIAEGIRRPKHLLNDFDHILSYIHQPQFYCGLGSVVNMQVSAPGKEEEVHAKEEPVEEAKITLPSSSNPAPEDVEPAVEDTVKGDTKEEVNGATDDKEVVHEFIEEKETPLEDANESNQQVSNEEEQPSFEDIDEEAEALLDESQERPRTRSGSTKRKATSKVNYDDLDDSSDEEKPKPRSRKGSAAVSKKDKESKKPKSKSVQGVIAVNVAESPSTSSKPQSRTQPSKRRRSFIPAHRHKKSKDNSFDHEEESSSKTEKHIKHEEPHFEAPPPDELVKLGRSNFKQHVGNIRRMTHTTPVSTPGARLHINTSSEKRKESKDISKPSPKIKQQNDLFNDLFSPKVEKRKTSAVSSSFHSSKSSFDRSFDNGSYPKQSQEDIPYTPSRPQLNTTGFHHQTPTSSNANIYTQATPGFSPSAYDPRNASLHLGKPTKDGYNVNLLDSNNGDHLQPPVQLPFSSPRSVPSDSSMCSKGSLHKALQQLDDLNSILD